MNILLVNPPIRERYPAQFVPIGLAYIGAVLHKEGHKVQVLDLNLIRLTPEDAAKKIVSENWDLVGIGGLITVYRYLKPLTLALKKLDKNLPIVVGGTVSDSIPDLIMTKTGTDIGVMGEGEDSILEIIEYLHGKRDISDIRGIFYRDENNNMKFTPPRERIKDPDRLPFPKWDLFDMEYYARSVESFSRGKKHTMFITSRGCPFQCTYCYRSMRRLVTYHSIEYLMEEIRELKEKYGITYLAIVDELFIANRNRALEFCEALKKEHPDVTWEASTRVNTVDVELLKAMKEAGCVILSYGFETGSPKMLKTIKKGVTVEDGLNAVEVSRKAGITFAGTFMFGIPGESDETMEETFQFFDKANLNCNVGDMFFVTPYPGTELYTYAIQHNLIKDPDHFAEICGDAVDFTINLTDWPDDVLKQKKRELEERIHKNYIKKNGYIKLLREHIKFYGYNHLLRDSFHYIRNSIRNKFSKK